MLVASLGNTGAGSALSFTDASGNYALGAITADGVTLNENASGATISQVSGTTIDLGAGTLTLNDAATNDTSYKLTQRQQRRHARGEPRRLAEP